MSNNSASSTPSAYVYNALFEAARVNNLIMVRCLVQKHHAYVNAADSNGMTALMHASYHGHLAVCQFLVETCRANVEHQSRYGWTALHRACNSGRLEIVQYLVQTAGANANAVNNFGCTPLHCAACHSHGLAIAKCLIESGGAKVETTGGDGRTALLIACLQCYSVELVQYLARTRPTNIDGVDRMSGLCALQWTCWQGELEIARSLIEEGGANAKAVTKRGENVLHVACSNVSTGIKIGLVWYLVGTCQVDAFAADHDGRTALHIATGRRNQCFGAAFYLMSRYPNTGHL